MYSNCQSRRSQLADMSVRWVGKYRNCLPLRRGRNRSFISGGWEKQENAAASAGPPLIPDPRAQNSPLLLLSPHGPVFLPQQNLITKEGQQMQNTTSALQRYNGFSPTSCSHAPADAPLSPHTTTGKGFASLRNQPSS